MGFIQKTSVFFLCFYCFLNLPGQNKNIDSLLSLIKADKEDSVKITHLTALSIELMYNNTDSAILIGKQSLEMAQNISASSNGRLAKIGRLAISTSLGNIGNFYSAKGDFDEALVYFSKALDGDEELKNKNGVARHQVNIGITHLRMGNYPLALEFILKALKIFEIIGDKKGIASSDNYLGALYYNMGEYPKALEYYNRSLKLFEELSDIKGLSSVLGNIGSVYSSLADYDNAIRFYKKALDASEGNKHQQASVLANLANIYGTLAIEGERKTDDTLFVNALKHYERALKLNEELGNKIGLLEVLSNMCSLYSATEKYKKAQGCFFEALVISNDIQAKSFMAEIYRGLSAVYNDAKHPLSDTVNGKLLTIEQTRLKAIYFYKKHLALRDSIFSEDNKKQLVQKEMNFEFEKKVAVSKALQDKKDIIAAEELKQKEQQRNYFIVGLALLAILSFFIFKGYRQKQADNKIIKHQKYLVEEKQKEILDSIHYAKRIQRALITNENYIKKSLDKLNRN